MKVQSVKGKVYIHGIKSLNLDHTLDCGQAFRWYKQQDGSYTGVAMNRVINASMQENTLVLDNCTIADYNNIWRNYFDMDRNYDNIKETLSEDAVLKDAVKYGSGIRILNQDCWECIVSFIISASNNIPRIKKIIELLCCNFGKKLYYNNKEYYTFPAPSDLANLTLDDLSVIRAGFRDKYILDAAKKVVSGQIDIEGMKKLNAADARQKLMSIDGVGEKVSSCILLFGLGKHDCFPIDVWIKRIIEFLYFDTAASIKDIAAFADAKFGSLGGYAQQYLFYYARENKLGVG